MTIADPIDVLFSDLERQFVLTRDALASIVHGFIKELNTGLTTPSTKLATMIPSFVTKLPTGNETGTFLSLDMGGTNLRISAVGLKGHGQVEVLELKRVASKELKTGQGDIFFDWIADTMDELVHIKARHLFSRDQLEGKESLALGICWSFPVHQVTVNRGTILRMGKGFTLTNTEGRDLSDMLHEAFERKGLNVKVSAILNDAVGTLVAAAYANPRSRIGFIFATGVNASYPEKVSAMKAKLEPDYYSSQDTDATMLLNTEIDIFGSESYLPLTSYDKALDAAHNQPKFQLYEKMMSGAYMGELVRLIALDFIKAGELFDGIVPEGFDEPYSFPTMYMSALESDNTVSKKESFKLLSKFHSVQAPTYQDINILTRICKIVALRSAALVCAAIAAMIQQQGLDRLQDGHDIIIGINGSTYEFYPYMAERVHRSLRSWFGTEVSDKIRMEIAKDGGSIGGALIAMLCNQEQ
ncbi:uncharacterized protein ATC70_007457 [Mucor velutinosus]|uniref:Phosphotransferase n=1 Tax=Mucor velutinosus TaxID=708070 RepID=A0AAN7HVY0_9FUNG|nr:hypothetical protein ATC70_007457 [Mucor velutinosus]